MTKVYKPDELRYFFASNVKIGFNTPGPVFGY